MDTQIITDGLKKIGSPATQFTDEDFKFINNLFKVMQGIFPAFLQAWPTESELRQAKIQWIKSFRLANLTRAEDISRGMDKFRLSESPFVPSPGQFIAMCKKEQRGEHDTRTKEDFMQSAPEKSRRKEVGKAALSSLLKDLRG